MGYGRGKGNTQTSHTAAGHTLSAVQGIGIISLHHGANSAVQMR